MKKILMTSLLAVTLVLSFSFTTTSKLPYKGIEASKAFKVYTIIFSQNFYIPHNACHLTVSVTVTFSWNGPGTPVTNVTAGNVVITPVCDGTVIAAKESPFETLDFDTDAMVTNLALGATGDSFIDGVISGSDFISWLKGVINTDINAHKI
jgi:hypothetical protein